MAPKKRIRPGEKIALKLTKAQRSLLLDSLLLIPEEIERAIRSTPATEPLLFSLDDLDDLAGHVAAAANHAANEALAARLDTISERIATLLDDHIDEPETPLSTTLKLVPVPDEPVIAERKSPRRVPRDAKAETYPLKLTALQRASLIRATRLPRGIKAKVEAAGDGSQAVAFARKELERMSEEVDVSARFAPGPDRKRLLAVLDKLDDLLDALDDGPKAGRDRGGSISSR